jgi:hypothetical protein
MGNQAHDNALAKFDKSVGKSLLEVLLEASSHGILNSQKPPAIGKIKDFCKPAMAAKRSA